MEGIADAYIFPSIGCKKWDTCAPEAVLCAAGGQLTDIFGNKIKYHATVEKQNYGGTIATLREHAKIVSLVPKDVVEEMEKKQKK